MENSDVIKIRGIFRSIKYQMQVRDKDGKLVTITNTPSIIIEFDNSLSLSEKCDLVYWDDTNALVYGVTNNGNVLRGAEHIGGIKPELMNAGALYCVDYSEIQQMRCELNEGIFMKFAEKIKAAGCKVNTGSEVVVTDDIIEKNRAFIFDAVKPVTDINHAKKLDYINNN